MKIDGKLLLAIIWIIVGGVSIYFKEPKLLLIPSIFTGLYGIGWWILDN